MEGLRSDPLLHMNGLDARLEMARCLQDARFVACIYLYNNSALIYR